MDDDQSLADPMLIFLFQTTGVILTACAIAGREDINFAFAYCATSVDAQGFATESDIEDCRSYGKKLEETMLLNFTISNEIVKSRNASRIDMFF